MGTQSGESPDHPFPEKYFEVNVPAPEGPVSKKSLIDTIKAKFFGNKPSTDRSASDLSLDETLPLGKTSGYQEYNEKNNRIFEKKPYNGDITDPVPELIREKVVSKTDLAETFLSEHQIDPEQLREDSRQIEPDDLKGSAELVYPKKT